MKAAPLVLVAALAAPFGLAATPALAAPSLEAAFGNTIVSTYPDGRTGHLWLKADGTYAYEGRRKDPSSGVWRIKGDQVCLKQRKPTAVPFTYCTVAPDGGVGATWTAKAVTGEKLEVKLVKGRVR